MLDIALKFSHITFSRNKKGFFAKTHHTHVNNMEIDKFPFQLLKIQNAFFFFVGDGVVVTIERTPLIFLQIDLVLNMTYTLWFTLIQTIYSYRE